MRHSYFGKKLSRTKNERRRLLGGLARELISHGGVRTTLARARAVRPLVEKLVSRAKQGTSGQLRQVAKVLSDKATYQRLLSDAKTRFGGRTSGFTRIVRLGQRSGDGVEEVLLSFVDTPVTESTPATRAQDSSVKRMEEQAVPTKPAPTLTTKKKAIKLKSRLPRKGSKV